MIVFSMRIVASDKHRTALLRTLGSIIGPTRAAPGCIDAHFYVDLDNRKVFALVEEWESHEHFDKSLNTEKLRTLVSALELSDEAPVVHIDSVVREDGIDALVLHRPIAEGAS